MAWADSVMGFLGLGKTQYDAPSGASYFGGQRDPNADYEQARREAQAAWAGQRSYEDVPLRSIDYAQAQSDYARQRGVSDLAMAAAMGQGPSAAQAQLRAATEQAIQNQYAAAAGARSSLAGAATARQAMMAGAALQQQAANESAALRAREQQAGMALAGELAGQMRGQSLGQSQAEAEYLQRQTEANRDATFRERQLAAQREQAAYDRSQGVAQMQTTASTAGATGALGASAQSEGESKKAWGGMLGGALGAGASALAMLSDRREKTGIEPARAEIDDWLDSLEPYRFAYRGAPEDKQAGVMAQDMERSRVGQDIVFEENGVKRLDGRKAFAAALAGLGALADRVTALEKGRR